MKWVKSDAGGLGRREKRRGELWRARKGTSEGVSEEGIVVGLWWGCSGVVVGLSVVVVGCGGVKLYLDSFSG